MSRDATKSLPSVFVIAWRALINNQARNLLGVIMEMQPGEMETDAIILLLPATDRGFQTSCFFFPSWRDMVSSLQLHINTTNTLSESKSRSLQHVVRDARVEKRRVPLTF